MARAGTLEEKLDALSDLAEILEREVHDPKGAAEAYGEIAQLSGDSHALQQKVRLLNAIEHGGAAQKALDAAVEKATDSASRAKALLARAELFALSRKFEAARADYDAALSAAPDLLPALAGLAELEHAVDYARPRMKMGKRGAAFESTRPTDPAQRHVRTPHEPVFSDPYARTAETANPKPYVLLKDALASLPRRAPERADLFRRLARLADASPLETETARWAWSEVLSSSPDDVEARERLELISRAMGDDVQLEKVLRAQIKAEPQSKHPRVELATLLERAGRNDDALSELRQAVRVDPSHQEAWKALHERLTAQGLTAEATHALAQLGKLSAPTELMEMDALERATGDFEAAEVRKRAFKPPPPEPEVEVRVELVRRIQARPLEANAYLALSDYFDDINDTARSTLMAEIGDALEGDPNSAPLPPKLLLSETDRAGLRHPRLRGKEGELLSLTGAALVRLFPHPKLEAKPFRVDSGEGAKASADALLAAVRILGIRAPDIFLSDESGPAFTLAPGKAERLLVGKDAVRKELNGPQLRFFAGRALFSQNPDLLLLRSLRGDQLARAMEILGEALSRAKRVGGQAKTLRAALPSKSTPRARELYAAVGRSANLTLLAEAARYSANRAGLVVCGGVAPALSALEKDDERAELIRFAASERYLGLRNRRS
ncbi:MAG: tetratricopeptide repeat protein [Myxococcaceae bacterium]